MNDLAARIGKLIERRGETFTVSGSSRRGVFAPLARSRAEAYLTSTELSAATPPIWLALVARDDATAAGNVVAWPGGTHTVRRVVEARWQGQVVARLLVLSA